MTLKAILAISRCGHDQTSKWGNGTPALWVMLGAWAVPQAWLWEVHHLVEIFGVWGPKLACVLAAVQSCDSPSLVTGQSRHSWPGK